MSYLLYLRSFVSVYRHSSISRAASTLSLTQPAVSRHVKLLEAHLGATLFTGCRAGWRPRRPRSSWNGRPVHTWTRWRACCARAKAARWPASRMSAPPAASSLLLPALAGLHRRGLRVDLRAMPPPALLSALAERVIDVAVTPARIPHVEYQLLHECPQRLVCAPQWSGRLPKAPRPGPAADRPAGARRWRPTGSRSTRAIPKRRRWFCPTIRPRWTRPAPAPDWPWRPNACAATPCGPGSWSPRRRPASAVLRAVRRARRDRCPSARATAWND